MLLNALPNVNKFNLIKCYQKKKNVNWNKSEINKKKIAEKKIKLNEK